ncbi:MAG: PKD domain-containing protein [Thermoplasmatales archaeon]|nr:MAG: PKD domain-containing protein [Thermoplasmatales archaeon]
MRKYLKKINLSSRIFSISMCALLITTSLVVAISTSEPDNDFEILSYSFSLPTPKLTTKTVDNTEFTSIDVSQAVGIGESHGAPMLPVQVVSLLLPPMKTVSNVIVDGTKVEMDLDDYNLIENPVFPYQDSVPFGDSPKEFGFDSKFYSKNALYPDNIKRDYHVGYSHGYPIFDISINPVQYNPVEGTLFYYTDITIDIELKDSEPNQFYRNNAEDEAWVEKLVFNTEVTDMYTAEIPVFGYEGGLCDPADSYQYVIVTTEDGGLNYWDTSEDIPYNWESLMDKHAQDDGFSCTLVTEQEINDCKDYQNGEPVDDLQSRIREFCRDAYQDWETSYILIGADDEVMPARHMDTSYETQIDSDIYWSNLDNTFNEDGDSSWGESGDSGFDLYSEIFIGRLTCDEPQDVSNWMTKSFYYADCVEPEFLEWAAFYGGNTGWNCEGDDFMDYSAIKGTNDWLGPNPDADGPFPTWAGFQYGFETWNEDFPDNSYDISEMWTAEPPNDGWQGGSESQAIAGFKNAINNDHVAIASGIAHANAQMSLDVGYTSWEADYHNTKPFFLHDYGCHCGDMDAADDGVLHSMLFHSDTELAYGVVYNTCYGWGNFDTTNSSSAFQAKEFWAYFLDLDNKSIDFNGWQLGKAHAFSKDRMAPTIDWDYSYGTWRAIIQGCLLFADPAQKIKTPHPSQEPDRPGTPSGKEYGVPEEVYEFTTSTTDPEGDQIFYLFDWGDGEYSEWLGPYTSGETVTTSHSWYDIGDYNIRVRARDEWGCVSLWSDVKVFPIVENTPPNKPTITGPTSGKVNKPYDFTIVTTDPDDQDVYYDIFWGNAGSGDVGPFPSGEEQVFEHTWTMMGSYTIKVKAKDKTSDWSEITEFNIRIGLSRSVENLILERIFQRFPNLFPVIRYLLGL